MCNEITTQCKNCGKQIIITKSKSDYYRRSMLKKLGYTFCNNKCSIQYNQLQKFYTKYNPIIDDLRNDYEHTTMQIKEIMKKYNLSQATWIKIVDRYNLKRTNNIKKIVYSNKNKKQVQNMTIEQKDLWKKHLSESGKKYWDNIDDADKQNRIQNNINTWNNKSDYEKQQIVAKINYTKQHKSPTEKIQYHNKISNSIKKIWKARSAEQKHKIWYKTQQSYHSGDQRYKIANDGKRFDSSYEKDVYEFCIRNNLEFQTQIPIEFEYQGENHITYIDFLIDGILFECKGYHLLQGVYDDKQIIPISKKMEIYKKHHVIIITDKLGGNLIPHKNSINSNGLKYLSKCAQPLIGVDIDLFKQPKFPFSLDKPECFYKVSVDRKRSPLSAWEDENIRWKMIKNRINYVGGFIDAKEILNAMNVTRTCKQPSWFSKSFAKQLINKYITTNIVLDPFAGWGTRCDACKELGIYYYGWDLNLELVNWHHKQGRVFENHYGINYADANNVRTDREECSVFICPPYTNFEIYFEHQDINKTQCEWLAMVMRNIPNAKEYLMVCKIIDKPTLNKFIVEQKKNKSHLGINYENVLLIRQKDRQEYLKIMEEPN